MSTWEHIPTWLRHHPQWVNWVAREVPGKHKVQKIPVLVDASGSAIDASANAPSTWRTWDEALAHATRGAATGLGLCPKGIAGEHGKKLCILDLDNCEPIAWLPSFQAADLYMEASPSGNGIRSVFWLEESHPVVQGIAEGRKFYKLDDGRGNPAGELYVDGGYATFTGDMRHQGSEKVLSELPFGLTVHETQVDQVEVGDVTWDNAQPLQPGELTGTALSIYKGEQVEDRSDHMLYLLAKLSWQCTTVEELAGRAWATPNLRQYFIDHRSERGEYHQREFARSECAKAWTLRDQHKTREAMFELIGEQVASSEYSYHLQPLDDVQMDPPDWAINNLMVADSTLFVGAPGSGKSMVLCDIAVALATGNSPMGFEVNREPGFVVYLASEDKAGVVQRLRGLMKGKQGAPILVHVIDNALTEEELTHLAAELEAYAKSWGLGIRAVLMDTYVGYSTAKENDADEVQSFLRSVKKTLTTPWGASFGVAHHMNKEGGPRGSTNLPAFFDLIWTVEDCSGFTQVSPFKVKQFDKKLVPPFSMQIKTDEEGDLTLSRVSGKPPVQPEEGDILEPSDVDTPHWQRVRTEHLIIKLVGAGDVTSASRLAKGPEYKKLREMAISQAGDDRRQHPLPPSHCADVVERLVLDGLLKMQQEGRGWALTLGDKIEAWTPLFEYARLQRSFAYKK